MIFNDASIISLSIKNAHNSLSSFLQTEFTLSSLTNNTLGFLLNQNEIKKFFIVDYLISTINATTHNNTCDNIIDILIKAKKNNVIYVNDYTCYTIKKRCNVDNCEDIMQDTIEVVDSNNVIDIYDDKCIYKPINANMRKMYDKGEFSEIIKILKSFDGTHVITHNSMYIRKRKKIADLLLNNTNCTNSLYAKSIQNAIDYFLITKMISSIQGYPHISLIELINMINDKVNDVISNANDIQLKFYSSNDNNDITLILMLGLSLVNKVNKDFLSSDNFAKFIDRKYVTLSYDNIIDLQHYYRNNVERKLIFAYDNRKANLIDKMRSKEDYAKCMGIKVIMPNLNSTSEINNLIQNKQNGCFSEYTNNTNHTNSSSLNEETILGINPKLIGEIDNEIFALPKNENEENGTLDLLNEIGEDELKNSTDKDDNETLDLTFSIDTKAPKNITANKRLLYRSLLNEKNDTITNDNTSQIITSYHNLRNKTIKFITAQINQVNNFIKLISNEYKDYYLSIRDIIDNLNANFKNDFPSKVKPELVDKKYEKLKHFIKLEKKILHKLFNATEIATKILHTISTEMNNTQQIKQMSLVNLNRLSLYAIELKRIANKHKLKHFYIDIWVNLIEKILKIKDKEITNVNQLDDIKDTIHSVINGTTIKNKYAVFNKIYSDIFKTYQKLFYNIEGLISNQTSEQEDKDKEIEQEKEKKEIIQNKTVIETSKNISTPTNNHTVITKNDTNSTITSKTNQTNISKNETNTSIISKTNNTLTTKNNTNNETTKIDNKNNTNITITPPKNTTKENNITVIKKNITTKTNATSKQPVLNITLNKTKTFNPNANVNNNDDSFLTFLKTVFSPSRIIYNIIYYIICIIIILFYITFFKRIIYYAKIYLSNKGYDERHMDNKRKIFLILVSFSILFFFLGLILYHDILIGVLFCVNGLFIGAAVIFEGPAGSRFGNISFGVIILMIWIKFALINSKSDLWIKIISFIISEVIGVLIGGIIGVIRIVTFIEKIREAKERVDIV